ncbi:MAG: hypothetical protein LQ340_000857 [Diploschistes diacapsis]|nr:MAG: hypothetical protein LQ340_000857 [Diploschistes diacapsis]
MFRKDSRPVRSSDSLGNYKYFTPVLKIDPPNYDEILQYFRGAPTPVGLPNAAGLRLKNKWDWEKDGSIVVSGVFDWLFNGRSSESGLLDGLSYMTVIDTEFAMYKWHLRERSGQSKIGYRITQARDGK